MSVGTWEFDLRTCWGLQRASHELHAVSSEAAAPRHQELHAGVGGDIPAGDECAQAPGSLFGISGLSMATAGARSTPGACFQFYRIKVGTESGQTRVALVSVVMAERLLHRYQCSSPALASECSVARSVSDHQLPGADNEALVALVSLVRFKYSSIFYGTSWTLSADLYTLWSLTSKVSTKLFADSLNESGVLRNFCSMSPVDTAFGSSAGWEDVEGFYEGGAGNPPFDAKFIAQMMHNFDAGCRRQLPYCRCVLLPLGKRYGVKTHVRSPSSRASLVVSIPGGTIPFKQQATHLAEGGTHPKPCRKQELYIVIGVNREYINMHPPPADVEIAYMRWVARACCKPERVQVHYNALQQVFPVHLRCNESVAELLPVPDW